MDAPAQLTPTETHEAIQTLLSKLGNIAMSRHVRDRALDRNFTVDDLWHVLEKGVVSPVAEWDDAFGNWRYRVSGTGCDREPLTLVVAIDLANERLTVITAF